MSICAPVNMLILRIFGYILVSNFFMPRHLGEIPKWGVKILGPAGDNQADFVCRLIRIRILNKK